VYNDAVLKCKRNFKYYQLIVVVYTVIDIVIDVQAGFNLTLNLKSGQLIFISTNNLIL